MDNDEMTECTGRKSTCPCEACSEHRRNWRVTRRAELREIGLPADDPRHGSVHAYGLYGCRCPKCKAAKANYSHQRVLNHDGLPPGDPRHGRVSTYVDYGCRCAHCRVAASVVRSQYEQSTRESR